MMVKISNFETALEIAFGLNALFFLYELLPRSEELLEKLIGQYEEAYDEKVKATGSTEAFPIGFVISATYPYKKLFMTVVTMITSLIMLGLILYGSFAPDVLIPARLMALILVFALFITPFLAYRTAAYPVRAVRTAMKALQDQSSEANNKKWHTEAIQSRAQNGLPPLPVQMGNPPERGWAKKGRVLMRTLRALAWIGVLTAVAVGVWKSLKY